MARTSTALESPTFAQNTFVPTIRTETQVLPLNLKFMRESLYRPSATVVNAFISWSLTSVESTTRYCIFA